MPHSITPKGDMAITMPVAASGLNNKITIKIRLLCLKERCLAKEVHRWESGIILIPVMPVGQIIYITGNYAHSNIHDILPDRV
jgi:hypothetical protein